MEKKSYEVLTDNFPRRAPVGAGVKLDLYEIEARYSVLSGDLKEVSLDPEPAPAAKPKGKKPEASEGAGAGEGEGA